MKIKTLELLDAALDWAVAKCEGLAVSARATAWRKAVHPHLYSTDWARGGPIIERERIAVGFDGFDDIDSALPIWSACKYVDGFERYGPTPLVAAMRCYVASKLGNTVDVPEELVQKERNENI